MNKMACRSEGLGFDTPVPHKVDSALNSLGVFVK